MVSIKSKIEIYRYCAYYYLVTAHSIWFKKVILGIQQKAISYVVNTYLVTYRIFKTPLNLAVPSFPRELAHARWSRAWLTSPNVRRVST